MKDRAGEIEIDEKRRWERSRAGKVTYLVSRLMLRHKKERDDHAKRLTCALDEARNERDKKLERMKRNYQHLERQADTVHQLAIEQVRKSGKHKGSISMANLHRHGSIQSKK